MAVRFFITIDTEEDDWDRYKTTGHQVENVKEIVRLQKIFDDYGALPTYLATYPVVNNDMTRNLLSEIFLEGRCEIGTHCHPWNTPPFEEEINQHHSMICNLSSELIARKIATLHEKIKKSLGVEPRCFRAGRWGFDAKVAKVIHNLGYPIDTSVTPFVDWSDIGGPDFRNAPRHIYRFMPDEVLVPDFAGVTLEVPATIGFLQTNYDRCDRIMKILSNNMARRFYLRSLLDRTRLLNFRWFSPELTNHKDMIVLAKTQLLQGASYLNMVFHSTSLLPGINPFVRTQSDLTAFLKNIEQMLQFAVDEGLVFSTLSDAIPENSRGLNLETKSLGFS